MIIRISCTKAGRRIGHPLADRILCLLLLLSAGWLPGTLAAASPPQSHQAIREAARQHVLKQITDAGQPAVVTAGRLDSRLKLARCDSPLETFSPPGKRRSAKQTVGVRCNGKQSWTLYVPVTVSMEQNVLVATHSLSRGSVLRPADVRLERRDTMRLHRGYLTDPAQVLGRTLKRPLSANRVIVPGQITRPQAVKRGSDVVILGTTGSLTVRMKGKALSSGARGERIRVMNKSSKRRLEATVVAPGVVQVTL